MQTSRHSMTNIRTISPYEREVLLRKDYRILGKAINSGSFASVFKAIHKEQKIAVKVIDCEFVSDDYRLKFLPRELYALKKLKHPYIITVYDIYTIANRVFIFMELAEGGDVIDLVYSGPVSESKAKVLYKQVCSALLYMHGLGLAHRDIKSENILLNKTRTIAKLTDFGFTRLSFDRQTGRRLLSQTHCGSAAYVAPELLEPGPVDAIRADCWSIGVVLYVLVNNRLPFTDKRIAHQLRKQKNRRFVFVIELSPECEDLIRRLLNPDIKLRYDMNQVLSHKWLKNAKLD